MKKNCQIHIWIESDLLELLKKQANENHINIPELCRRKLRKDPRLDRMEIMINRFEKILKMSHEGGRKNTFSRRKSFIKLDDNEEVYDYV